MADQITLQDQNVLVTGGHGFIGRHVVSALSHAGANPLAISQHEGSALPDLPGKSVTVDLEERRGLDQVMKGVDAVIHLAARAGGIQFQQKGGGDVFATNRRVTDNLLAASAEADVQRVFLASSLVTYRAADGTPHRISRSTRAC